MKVVVSVQGRFHAFNLAQQLQKRGMLHQLITSYPKFFTRRFGIEDSLVTSLLPQEVALRAWRKLPAVIRKLHNPQHQFSVIYDLMARSVIRRGGDIFVGWSGSSLRAMRRARQMGMMTIIERGSSHIACQAKLLEEEWRLAGHPRQEVLPKVIKQEQQEYAEADYISVPSGFAKKSFMDFGFDPDKIIQAPYGADLSEFSPVPRTDDIFRVIVVGGLTLRKGSRYLLQAFNELNLPDAQFWHVGTVSPEIMPFVDQYRTPAMTFHGHVKQDQLKNFYSQADVFCLPSIEEGFAMVIFQAMACGLPAICSTNTGGEDIIKDGVNGFIIPIRDVAAIKDKIRWCYEHRDQCRSMGQAAKQCITSNFSWDGYGHRIVTAYQDCLNRFQQARQG